MSYFEEQFRHQQEMQAKREGEARNMTDAELRSSKDWYSTCLDHSCETGDARGNIQSSDKLSVIETEMRRRGIS